MKIPMCAVLALAAVFALPDSSRSQVKVIGGGLASACSENALDGRSDLETLRLCSLALDTEVLGRDNSAKTLVNRAVIYYRRQDFRNAQRDLAQAQRLMPGLPEVYINRGAVLIRLKRYQEALEQLNQGIDLNPLEPEKAYYNRAVAKEALDDLTGAYLDFRRAGQLNPEWEEPKKQLSRFTVERRQ